MEALQKMNSFFERNSHKMEEESSNDGLFYQSEEVQYNYRKIVLDVVLIDQSMNETETLPNMSAIYYCDQGVLLKQLLEDINNQGYNLDGQMIFYQDQQLNMSIYCGNYPILSINFIPIQAIISDSVVLKFRMPYIKISKIDIKQEVEDQHFSSSYSFKKVQLNQKRTKERKIIEVLQSVALWRQFYKGFYDQNGNYIKISLEESALKLDISKKTLDDYLLQIRLATKYKFNFIEHLNEKMGVLRAFVKKQRDIEKQINQQLNQKHRCHFKEIDLDLSQFLPLEMHQMLKIQKQSSQNSNIILNQTINFNQNQISI